MVGYLKAIKCSSGESQQFAAIRSDRSDYEKVRWAILEYLIYSGNFRLLSLNKCYISSYH
jgi:hypothetical protein